MRGKARQRKKARFTSFLHRLPPVDVPFRPLHPGQDHVYAFPLITMRPVGTPLHSDARYRETP